MLIRTAVESPTRKSIQSPIFVLQSFYATKSHVAVSGSAGGVRSITSVPEENVSTYLTEK